MTKVPREVSTTASLFDMSSSVSCVVNGSAGCVAAGRLGRCPAATDARSDSITSRTETRITPMLPCTRLGRPRPVFIGGNPPRTPHPAHYEHSSAILIRWTLR